MKASEAIELALESYYGFCGDGTSKSEFMCLALEGMLRESGYDNATECAVCEAKGRIDIKLSGHDTLMSYLTEKESEYEFIGYGNDTKEAYEYRVSWWKAFIEELKAKGL